MENLEYKNRAISIIEVLKDKHYKVYINSAFINYYDTMEHAKEAARRHIDLFMKGDRE
jgi:hypothetical protein